MWQTVEGFSVVIFESAQAHLLDVDIVFVCIGVVIISVNFEVEPLRKVLQSFGLKDDPPEFFHVTVDAKALILTHEQVHKSSLVLLEQLFVNIYHLCQKFSLCWCIHLEALQKEVVRQRERQLR